MKTFSCFSRLFLRFRYPFSLPEDIASALGVNLSNSVTFDEFMSQLTSPTCCPNKLIRLMPRKRAEEAFCTAQRKEFFKQTSLFSYYFNEGWLEFKLEFDSKSLLRRVYIQHKKIEGDRGIEIQLPSINGALA